MRLALILISALMLSNCSSTPEIAQQSPLIPIPAPHNDPADAVAHKAIQAFLARSEAPVSSQYEFSRVDLDSDGRRDALVLFKNPYGYWCGMHGCTMLVLKAHNDRFTLINSIQPVREPLYIADAKQNGWKDLIVRVSGRWNDAKDVKMSFNGRQYPDNPSNLPSYSQFKFSKHTAVFKN